MTTESFTSLWAHVGLLSHPSLALSLNLALPWVSEGEGHLAWPSKEALRCCRRQIRSTITVSIKVYPVPATGPQPRHLWIGRVGREDGRRRSTERQQNRAG